MKNLLRACCALLFFIISDTAGQVPEATPPPRLQVPALPVAYPAGVPLNYIRTWQPSRAVRDVQALQQDGRELWETRYFDGLGRSLQTVDKGKSPLRGDIVTIAIPETRGGQGREYLPFTFEGGNGRFRHLAFADQYRFWSTAQPQEQVFFGSKSHDPSPGRQVRKICAPGNSWQGNGRGQSFLFPAHTKPDEVACWNTGLQEGALPMFAGMYETGALQKEVSVDENQRQQVAYKDKEGRVVMRKVPVAAGAGNGHNGYACTYFLFDPLGRLRYIFPPELVAVLVANGWKLSAALAADLAFRFEYDARGRKVTARTPGIPETEYVYDARDRLVLQRSGNLRATGRWMATGYDALNRPVLTGVLTTVLSGAALRDWAGKNTILPPGKLDTLTQTFYDHYRFPGAAGLLPAEMEKARTAGGAAGDPQPSAETANGKVTGIRVRVLGTTRWLLRTLRYDQNMRLCQETGTLHTGGTETITRLYNFSGNEIIHRHLHTHPRSKVLQVVQTMYQYDHAGRTMSVAIRLNDNPAWQRTVTKMDYGPSGELSRKSFLRANGSVLESLQYQYNVRGWLTGINADHVKPVPATPHYFGQSLHYDNGFTHKQFNGNIAGVQWKGSCDPVARAYGFAYDPLDRLLLAKYSQPGNPSAPNFDLMLGNGADPAQAYDLNGNIRRLRHWGTRGVQSSQLLDDLRYQYKGPTSGSAGNQLLGVADMVKTKAPGAGDFTDDPGASLSDYTYDSNGNMLRDRNKSIDSIRWNVLDLPEEIIVKGKGKVQYQYDASGNKLSHTVFTQVGGKTEVVRVDYLSGFVYRNDTLQYCSHGEGRVRPVTGVAGFAWDYFVRDHLGSVRMLLTDELSATVYLATMEPSRASLEHRLFSQVDAVRGPLPSGFPVSQGVANTAVARLNGKDPRRRVGPGLVLKVMPGDTLQIGVKAFYQQQGGSAPAVATPLQDMVLAVLGAFGGTGMAVAGKSGGAGEWVSPFSNKVTADGWRRLMQQSSATAVARRPRAYLNILLFDEQLNLVTAHSIVKQVSVLPGKLQVLGEGPSVMKRSGYLYVFLSNESQQDVYFDDLTVNMRHGPVMEETHYYPFGLVMPGISVKALRRPVNNILFNGKILQQIDGNSVVDQEWYDYGARMFDPQLGRWLSPDKLSEQYESVSPYAYALNDPVNAIDPDGNLIIFVNGFMIHQWMAQDHRLTIRTAQRSMVDRGTFLTEFTQQRNPNFRPYPGERTFAEGAPTYLGKPFQYWGNIDDVFMQGHNDRNTRYISASADNASQAHERYADGAMAARRLIRQLDSRQIPLASDETIKIVGHSQGAAFAAGMVSVLSKHAKYSSRLEIAYYIAPHQPGDFLHSAKVKGQQWSTFHDWVTDGWNFIHLFNGGSKNQKIEGIGEKNYERRAPWVEGMGGHYVETYLEDIIRYFRNHGVTVNVY